MKRIYLYIVRFRVRRFFYGKVGRYIKLIIIELIANKF